MSFADTLKRLDDVVMNWQPGEQAETCRVRRQDLRELLHHFRRLDAEVRQNPAPQPNVAGEVTHEDICNTHEGGPCNCDWSAADDGKPHPDDLAVDRFAAAMAAAPSETASE